MKNLTAKERLFCRLAADGYSTRDAAVKSGYHVFPERSAAALLERGEIKAEIERLSKAHAVGRDEIAAGLRRLAFGSVADAVRLACTDEPGPGEIDEMDLFCVSEIKRGKNGVEIKFFDRLKALQFLGQLSSGTEDTAEPFYRALEQGAVALSRGESSLKDAEGDRPWS